MRKFNVGDRVVVARPAKKLWRDSGKRGTVAYFYKANQLYDVDMDDEFASSLWLGRELDRQPPSAKAGSLPAATL